MVDLRDQLGALLSLEVKYATRDYLMDIATSQHEHCDESTTAYKDTPSRDYHEDEKTDDTSQSLSRSTTPTNNALITEQHAMDWREKICEWSYQGEYCIKYTSCLWTVSIFIRYRKTYNISLT